ncbi:MAG: HDOD domain-containing protein, partial [Marinobacter sp.]|nr:HDOD domain-containing protein [Marinobacter sp.]
MDIAPDIQLPSLPEVTLRALEACHQEESYRSISDIVSTDTALAARVLALANSAMFG